MRSCGQRAGGKARLLRAPAAGSLGELGACGHRGWGAPGGWGWGATAGSSGRAGPGMGIRTDLDLKGPRCLGPISAAASLSLWWAHRRARVRANARARARARACASVLFCCDVCLSGPCPLFHFVPARVCSDPCASLRTCKSSMCNRLQASNTYSVYTCRWFDITCVQ